MTPEGDNEQPGHDTDPTAVEPLSIDELRDAAAAIADQAEVTPVATEDRLDDLVGARVFCKLESQQRAGAFKFRGAFNRLSRIPADDRPAGVVAVSSGNHGAAVATAAATLGMPATIYIPEDAPAAKRAVMEGAGAEIVTFPRTIADREAPARARASELGATFVHPFEDRAVMAGQGTAAVELHEQVGPLDLLVVQMSGGGLMAGAASAMATLDPGCRMVGVEPEAGDDNRRSFAAGEVVTIPQPTTIADGLAVTAPGVETLTINRRLVERIVTVTDDEIVAAMAVLHDLLGLRVEPSGAAGLAWLLAGHRDGDHPVPIGRRSGADRQDERAKIGVILSGGNIDAARFERLLAGSGGG